MSKRPRRFIVRFHRGCPRGIGIGPHAVEGSLSLLEYDEAEAGKAARFILDGHCVIDSVDEVPPR